MIKRLALLLLLCPIAAPAKAPPRPAAEPGMVSAADPRAAAAGVEILRAGGSAADAAVAMMLALNVVEPLHSGLGGGGFMVYSDAARRLTSYDGREAAPAAADPYWFHVGGRPLSHSAAVPGGRSVGVPGNLRLMWLAHERHGKLPWARLFGPAIRLARDGYAITPRLHNFLANFPLPMDDWGRAYLYDAAGQARPVGTVVTNPRLAAQFARIAAQGPDYFYSGAQAEKLVATVDGAAHNPSKMTVADLAGYRAKPRAPICGTYRGYRICGMGPPASGAVAVLTILGQLERFDMAGMGKDSAAAWHLFAESSRLAYADRDAYLADPDHVTVPVAGLLDPAYIAARSALIAPDRSMATVSAGTPAGAPPRPAATPINEHGTTDLVAVDRQGAVAEVTTTIESVAGSGLSIDGAFLNNELTDFDIVPVQNGAFTANRVEGGKRPRSSMSPTIVYGPDGKVRIAIGAAGGSTIIAQVAKALVAVLDWHMSAQDAIALGLLYAPGDTAILEKGTALEAMAPALAALGQKVAVAPLGLKANAIERVAGHWVGAADPRSEGVAMGEDMSATAIGRVVQKAGTPSE
ncbi:gamma-glutamyltransferase family protein [Sphingomonas bacterium]|uniref:gamma-glutamyltransferase family protein n=1 Tax=Sphingomonas bacterium TaxID=1895847 RepID=UPI001576DC84|nr:gamma-glutamyltransferase family protein [Sphingomonas bacterium]